MCICVSGDLSGTLKSAEVARDQLPGREIHVIDTRSASMGQGMLAQIAAELAAEGVSGAEIARVLEHRKEDLRIFLALDTLEYLKRGGRISGARAAIGTMLNVKPIIAVENGIVENAERVRSRPKARERTLELLTQAPLERASILHTTNGDIDEFMAGFMALLEAGSVARPADGRGAVRRAASRPRLRRRRGAAQALNALSAAARPQAARAGSPSVPTGATVVAWNAGVPDRPGTRRLERPAIHARAPGRSARGTDTARGDSRARKRRQATGNATVTVRLRQGDDRAMADPRFRLYSIPRGIASRPAARPRRGARRAPVGSSG